MNNHSAVYGGIFGDVTEERWYDNKVRKHVGGRDEILIQQARLSGAGRSLRSAGNHGGDVHCVTWMMLRLSQVTSVCLGTTNKLAQRYA